MTDEEWDRDLAVNLSGPFYLCRAALLHLLESGGNIVNVTSIAGVQGEVYSAGYCAAKHGRIGLTRALAIEFSKETLRVNAVCPGGMPTAQATEFKAPDDADWNLILRIASRRADSWRPSTWPRRSRFWRATMRRPSTVRSTASTTARVPAEAGYRCLFRLMGEYGVGSMSGRRSSIRSASIRAEPDAMVQPTWPWPVL